MSWAELVAAAEGVYEAAATRAPQRPIAGIGWATVDQERARAELDGLLAADPAAPRLAPWAPLDRDPSLGSSVWVRLSVGSSAGPALVVLEPDTEGPLAASLARFGEGVAVLYLGEGAPRTGGLTRGGPAWGPHIVVMDAAAPAPEAP